MFLQKGVQLIDFEFLGLDVVIRVGISVYG